MIKALALLLFILTVLMGRSYGQENFRLNTKRVPIKIDVSQATEKAGLMKLQKILLLKNPMDVISSVDKILINDNLIFAFDKQQELLHSFSLDDGTYINTLNKIGVAPNETVGLADFAIDSLKNEVILYDPKGRKLVFVDFNGTFQRVHPILPYAREFSVLNKNELLFYFDHNFPGESTNFAIIDYAGELKTKFFPMPQGKCLGTELCGITSPSPHSDEMYVSNSFGNTIYLLDKDRAINPVYYFDCGSASLPDDPKEICNAFDQGLNGLSVCFLTKRFFVLKNKKTYISYIKEAKFQFLIVESSGNIAQSYTPKEEFYKRIFNVSIGSYQNNLISVISPYHVKSVLTGDSEKQFSLKTEAGDAEMYLRTFDKRNGSVLIGIFEIK
jgi:hypothetical protein